MEVYIKKIALNINGWQIENAPGFKFSNGPQNESLGSIVTGFLNIFYILAGFFLLAWMTWGFFEYILASGDKNNLAKARQRVLWATIGFLVITISFAVTQYIQKDVFAPQNVQIQRVTPP